MTESSLERTRRIFIKHLTEHEWNYQYSFFYTSTYATKDALEHSLLLRETLRRKFKENYFLWRLCLKNLSKDREEGIDLEEQGMRNAIVYHSVFTNNKIPMEDLKNETQHLFEYDIIHVTRSISEKKIRTYAKAVKFERPHNLKKYFEILGYTGNIHRFSLINKKLASRLNSN